jgi:hypothetical protein
MCFDFYRPSEILIVIPSVASEHTSSHRFPSRKVPGPVRVGISDNGDVRIVRI